MTKVLPSLNVIRPITNLTSEPFKAVQERYGELKREMALGSMGVIRFNIRKQDEYSVSLLNSGEILGFHRAHDLPFGVDERNALADHLNTVLPDKVDDYLDVDTFPMSVYGLEGSRNFCIGAGDLVFEERQCVLAAITKFYGIKGDEGALWKDNESFTRVSIVSTYSKNQDVVDRTARVLHESIIHSYQQFPEHIELDPVIILDVERQT